VSRWFWRNLGRQTRGGKIPVEISRATTPVATSKMGKGSGDGTIKDQGSGVKKLSGDPRHERMEKALHKSGKKGPDSGGQFRTKTGERGEKILMRWGKRPKKGTGKQYRRFPRRVLASWVTKRNNRRGKKGGGSRLPWKAQGN